MGMSTYVYGIVLPDDKWKRMKAITDACDLANIEYPTEVSEFFEYEKPDPKGIIINIEKTIAVKEYDNDSSSGYEVDITKIDPKIKLIRFVNSW